MRSTSEFWQKYLENHKIAPLSPQFPFIDIKVEPDESSHPIAIFLPCYTQADSKDDVETTITDDKQTINVLDFETQKVDESKIRLKKTRKVVERPGFCEICFKGNDFLATFTKFTKHILFQIVRIMLVTLRLPVINCTSIVLTVAWALELSKIGALFSY